MKTFVVGRSVTIGARAVARLIEAGHDVDTLVRSDAARVASARARARGESGRLFDVDGLRKPFAGRDAVANVATHIHSSRDAVKPGAWREDDLIRSEGSRVVVEAARAAGVCDFPALRSAGALAEPLTRSHRVSSLFTQATGGRPSHDCLQGGWSDCRAAHQSRDRAPSGSTR